MRKVALALAVVVVAAAMVSVPALSADKGKSPKSGKSPSGKSSKANAGLFALMKGKKEVGADGKKGAGDPDGRGTFTALIDGTELCYAFVVKDIATPVAAHIHKGSPSVAGPVFIGLTPPDAGDPGTVAECVTITADQANALLKNPRKYYVNVHTGDFPGGAVRSQLFRKK